MLKLWLCAVWISRGLRLKGKSVLVCLILCVFGLFYEAKLKDEERAFARLTLWREFGVITCLHLSCAAPRGAHDLGVTGAGFDLRSEVAVRSKVICQEVESLDWDCRRGIVWNVSCSLKVSLAHVHAYTYLCYVMCQFVHNCTICVLFLSSTFWSKETKTRILRWHECKRKYQV